MFAHCDANNFYASCERLFNPALNGKPVVVLSNNDGCVIARSNEAKALGIKMGDPVHQIREIIKKNKVEIFSSNFALYDDISNRMISILKQFAPATEVYSIDEAFMDVSGIDTARLQKMGRELVLDIRQQIGIPVSIGIAPTKTLAKVATKLCKIYPKLQGCCLMYKPADIEKVLKNYPVEDVWGIGRQHTKKLNAQGIKTAFDFIQLPPGYVRKKMTVVRLRTWKELRGESCISLENSPAPRKQIRTSRSFAKELSDYADIYAAVIAFTTRCAEKLRKQKSMSGSMKVFIYTNPFKENIPRHYESKVIHFHIPTDSTIELVNFAASALKSIYRQGYRYKKAGVILSDFQPKSDVQLFFFDNTGRPKHNRLMKAIDSVNQKQGRNTLVLAAQGFDPVPMNRQHLSQNYTTDWNDILTVKAKD